MTAALGASLRALRAFASVKAPAQRCSLCGAGLEPDPDHEHLLAPGAHVLCACSACAAAPAGLRPIPRGVSQLPGLVLTDADWTRLGVPVRSAFFVKVAGGGGFAVYPSPAGPVRSALASDAWEGLVHRAPAVAGLATEVEALLVIDVEERQAAFTAPIDVCYRLCGLVRSHWRGVSGGPELWAALDGFLAELRQRARDGARA